MSRKKNKAKGRKVHNAHVERKGRVAASGSDEIRPAAFHHEADGPIRAYVRPAVGAKRGDGVVGKIVYSHRDITEIRDMFRLCLMLFFA